MKKYIALVIGVVAIITMGGTIATTLSTLSIVVNINSNIEPSSMEGCMQMNCSQGGGCNHHNESNMTDITGVLTYEGSQFKIDTIKINFGSNNYLTTITSPYDFDDDGTIETLYNEILGLVGSSITVKGYLCCQGSKLVAFYINGIQYREPC